MAPKIALCMIVKGTADEAPMLDRCLHSVASYVDAVFIDVNAPAGKRPSKKVIDVAQKYTKHVRQTIWRGNFVQARNENFAQVTNEYDFIIWLDADDTVENPEKIRQVAAVTPTNVDGVYIRYDYEHDDYGNVTVGLDVSRLVRNNGTFKWKSSFNDTEVSVHETLNEVRSVGKALNEEFKIIHHSNDERRDASLERNIGLLEGMLERSKDNPDPRILFYLATHYYDAGFMDATKEMLEQYLTMSGWAEERAQAWVYLGDIYKSYKDIPKARGCYIKALAENPGDPIPYVELGELEMADQLWEKAIIWLESAAKIKLKPASSAVLRPLEGTYRAYKALAQANVQLGAGGIAKAAEWVTKAIKLRPTDPELLEAKALIEHMQNTVKLNESMLHLVKELRDAKEESRIMPLLDSLPTSLQSSPGAVAVRKYYTKPKAWEKNSIAIVCGTSALGHWGPWSLKEGIGGSEEAVIQLSKELTRLGYAVTVYATPGLMAGEHDGVQWKHYWEFNATDQFDVLIGWRMPHIFDMNLNAHKKYLWLHDVIESAELTKERLDRMDKIIFVSQYHADLYPEIPEKKKFASGNGIDPAQFEIEGVERNPKKVLYMSAHERGQEVLQLIWPDVLKEVPDAKCHCYYGWAGYDHINRDNPERMAWKAKLVAEQKTLKNFTDHGKIGHEDIVREVFSAGVWAYPTGFDEVYCISGVKAQAGGAWPVYSNHAALKDTVQFGDKIEIESTKVDGHDVGVWTDEKIEEFKQALINRLKNPATDEQRQEMMAWARTNMSWRNIAGGWDAEFRRD